MSEPTERPVRGRAALVLLGTFVLGLACGGALTVLGVRAAGGPMRHPPPGMEMRAPMEHMAHTLRLDPQQRRAIREILARDRERVNVLLEETHAEIRELLTPEQRERFDRMRPEGRLGRGAPRRGDRRFPRELPPPGDEPPPPRDDRP